MPIGQGGTLLWPTSRLPGIRLSKSQMAADAETESLIRFGFGRGHGHKQAFLAAWYNRNAQTNRMMPLHDFD